MISSKALAYTIERTINLKINDIVGLEVYIASGIKLGTVECQPSAQFVAPWWLDWMEIKSSVRVGWWGVNDSCCMESRSVVSTHTHRPHFPEGQWGVFEKITQWRRSRTFAG